MLDDVYTDEYGVKPKGRIDIPTPEREVGFPHIKGRHGTLTKKYGYKNIEIPIIFTMHSKKVKRNFRKNKMKLLNAKKLMLDDDLDVYYKIKDVEIEVMDNFIKTFGEFTVNFTLDPFQYEVENEPQLIKEKTKVNNPGYESQPILNIQSEGTGNVYVGEQEFVIKNINGLITVNSEAMNAYRTESGSSENLNDHMEGDFPVLPHGDSYIDFDGDIESVELIKNLRWV